MKHFNKDVGNYSESLAQKFLRDNNYIILDCNFKNKLGEIDIACIKNNILVIVEVKSRYTSKYGKPKESVNYTKQKRIIQVTKSYLAYKKLYNINVRFDVIEVFLNHNNNLTDLNHIKNAFTS